MLSWKCRQQMNDSLPLFVSGTSCHGWADSVCWRFVWGEVSTLCLSSDDLRTPVWTGVLLGTFSKRAVIADSNQLNHLSQSQCSPRSLIQPVTHTVVQLLTPFICPFTKSPTVWTQRSQMVFKVCGSVCLWVCLSVGPSIHLCVCLPAYLIVCSTVFSHVHQLKCNVGYLR